MRRYELSVKGKVLATIDVEKNAQVILWGDEEAYLGDYIINTLLLNADDDMLDLSYVAYDVGE